MWINVHLILQVFNHDSFLLFYLLSTLLFVVVYIDFHYLQNVSKRIYFFIWNLARLLAFANFLRSFLLFLLGITTTWSLNRLFLLVFLKNSSPSSACGRRRWISTRRYWGCICACAGIGCRSSRRTCACSWCWSSRSRYGLWGPSTARSRSSNTWWPFSTWSS